MIMRKQRRNGELKANIWKRILAGILLTALTVTALPSIALLTPTKAEAATVTLKNPRIVKDSSMKSGQKVTWDCIWFGSYPQREVVEDADTYAAIDESYYNPQTDVIEDASLFQKLENASGWSDNEIILNGEKYRRMKKGDALYIGNSNVAARYYQWKDSVSWHYFKYEPIKWRVLNVKGNSAFIQTDVAIDNCVYSILDSETTWETSGIRSWLNGYDAEKNQDRRDYSKNSFSNNAFSIVQQQVIQLTEVKNDDNTKYGTEEMIPKIKFFCYLNRKQRLLIMVLLENGKAMKPDVKEAAHILKQKEHLAQRLMIVDMQECAAGGFAHQTIMRMKL